MYILIYIYMYVVDIHKIKFFNMHTLFIYKNIQFYKGLSVATVSILVTIVYLH